MATVHPILAERTASIAELKKNPLAVIEQGEGFAVAVLNDALLKSSEPVFYCVPAKAYEALMDYMDELELAALVAERGDQKDIEVDIHKL
jgi:antitoxin StbD